jgi:6-phosphogluconolactonase/glucosamine-6-phosphate isomerase/deaminase
LGLRTILSEVVVDTYVGECNPNALLERELRWSPTPPRARLSLNLRALLDSRRIVILILGESKLRTYAAACGDGPVEEMPVRAVLRQQRVPVDVVWAP